MGVIGARANIWQPAQMGGLTLSIVFDGPLTVGSNVAPGAVIAQASVSGQTGPHTFTLTNDAGGKFVITSGGELAVGLEALTSGVEAIAISASNGVDSPVVTLFSVVVENVTLTPTTMQTSVTDPLTGHVYSFVAADGVTPEAREVGQYQDGTWFVKGSPGDEVRIGSITPVSDLVSTAAYIRPDNLNDEASTGARMRARHGTMVNPWQGQSGREARPLAFDSYYGFFSSADVIPYDHSLNVDPGATGEPLELAEGSVVKSESVLDEGGHTISQADKTRILQFSILTVVPEIPAANSFRPSMRGTDKRSYWTTDQLDIAGKRTANTGDRPFTTTHISNVTARIKHIQNVFAPYQEPARRWNPGAHGNGVDIYGDDWYGQFSAAFAAFYGDYTDAELEDLLKATVQVGIDIYGLLNDNGYYYPAQAHHAGRKGICFMAGFLLDNQDILDKCDFNLNPRSFGVDDHYCGSVSEPMINVQGRHYKGRYPYPWTTEMLGLAEWSTVFPEGTEDQVDSEEQVADADFPLRSYQVLSFDNGALYQALFGMIADPTGQYYNHAYFDFTDRYLGVRVGDRLDGLWNARDPDNGHFIGNFYSIDPSAETVQFFQNMRDLSAWPNYLESMIPEALPKPQVSHTPGNDYLDVDFNTNNFQSPQNKHAAITGYDLRWLAWAGGADAVTGEDDEAYIGNFEWRVIEDITLPYQLSGVPRGLKAQVQLRMKNVNGPGPFLDDRKRQFYEEDSLVFDVNADEVRYSELVDVPDVSDFDEVPQNWGPPTLSPASVVTGVQITATEGVWTDNPATQNTEIRWVESVDGSTGWTVIAGADSLNFIPASAQEGKYVRPEVRKTNIVGTSPWAEAKGSTAVSPPLAVAGGAAAHGTSAFDPGLNALGGKKLLILSLLRENNPIAGPGLTIGAHTFDADEIVFQWNQPDTSGGVRERQFVYIVEVPSGETATEITFNNSDPDRVSAVYPLSTDLELIEIPDLDFDGSDSGVTEAGGMAFFMARSDSSISFTSSDQLVEHSDSAASSDGDWVFAHSFATIAGTATVNFDQGFSSNTRAHLLTFRKV